jgi:hypothetical protein
MHKPVKSHIKYMQNPDVSYTVESSGLILINKRTGDKYSIGYPQAAVWDLIIKNYTFDKIARMISNILIVTKSHANSIVLDSLEFLYKKGLILEGSNG